MQSKLKANPIIPANGDLGEEARVTGSIREEAAPQLGMDTSPEAKPTAQLLET